MRTIPPTAQPLPQDVNERRRSRKSHPHSTGSRSSSSSSSSMRDTGSRIASREDGGSRRGRRDSPERYAHPSEFRKRRSRRHRTHRYHPSEDSSVNKGWVVTRSASALDKQSPVQKLDSSVVIRKEPSETPLQQTPEFTRSLSDLSNDSALSDPNSAPSTLKADGSWSEGSTVDVNAKDMRKKNSRATQSRKKQLADSTVRSKRSSLAAARGESASEQARLEQQRIQYLMKREAIRKQKLALLQQSADRMAQPERQQTNNLADSRNIVVACNTPDDSDSRLGSVADSQAPSEWTLWDALHSQLAQELQTYSDFMSDHCASCLDEAMFGINDDISLVSYEDGIDDTVRTEGETTAISSRLTGSPSHREGDHSTRSPSTEINTIDDCSSSSSSMGWKENRAASPAPSKHKSPTNRQKIDSSSSSVSDRSSLKPKSSRKVKDKYQMPDTLSSRKNGRHRTGKTKSKSSSPGKQRSSKSSSSKAKKERTSSAQPTIFELDDDLLLQ